MSGMNVTAASRERLKSRKEDGGVVTVKGSASTTEPSAVEREKLSSLAGKGLKGDTSSDAPKQEAGESLSSFAARMRSFREKRRGVTMDHAGAALGGKMERK